MFKKSLVVLFCSFGLAGCSAGYAQYGGPAAPVYAGPAYGAPAPGYGGYGGGVGYCRSGVYSPDAGGCVHAMSQGQLDRASPPMGMDPQCDGRDGYWTQVGGATIHRTCVYDH